MVFQGRRNSPRVIISVAFSGALLVCSPASAAVNVLDLPSPSNYGGAGLLDTRTARFFPDGYLNFTASLTAPDSRYALTFQALPWAEFTFRYVDDPHYSAGQFFRNFDIKILLSKETEFWPEIAGGIQDFIGQREYGAEYFVASKRWGDFDFSLGLGWGRFGSRGAFENPFGLIAKSFLDRPDSTNPQGGGILFNQFFHGPEVGLFGGVEYNTPIRNLKFKIEYSSDTYPSDTANYRFPVNAGFSYRPLNWLDIGLSVMHGHYLGLRISALMDAKAESFPARIDAPPRFRARAEQPAGTILKPGQDPDGQKPNPEPAGDAGVETHYVDLTQSRPGMAANPQELGFPTAPALPPALPSTVTDVPAPPPRPGELASDVEQRIKAGLDNQKLKVMGMSVEHDKLTIIVENPRYRRNTEAISRVARILSAAAPAEINSFEITLLIVGQPAATVTLQRRDIDALARRAGSPAELFETAAIAPGQLVPLNHLAPDLFPQFTSTFFPLLQEDLFDPNNPIYLRVGVGAVGELRLTRSWFIDATGFATIWDNFGQITRLSNSVLPHVRSDVPLYLKDGRYGFANVSTSYYFKLAPEVYGRLSGGILEQMFDGVGGELLYRPFNARWAIGLDAWDVIQRGYRELWDVRKYQVFTGHITAYYQLPWYDLGVAVSAGQYLAGDKGATFQFWRSFSTGVQVGAWFTLTNVDGAKFGEGSFDKGIEIIIPLEWIAPFASRSVYDLQLRPLQRDGGQRLLGDMQLYGMTNGTDYGAFTSEWNRLYR